MIREPIVPGADPGVLKLIGKWVSFNLHRKGGAITSEQGEVTAQKWLGLTERGLIPEYEVTIVGRSNRAVLARVTEDHVMPLDF